MSRIEPKILSTRSGRPLVIRTAEPRDADALIALSKSIMAEGIYALSQPDEFTMTTEQEAEWIEAHRKHVSHLCLVAECGVRVVALLDFKTGHRRRIAHTGEFGLCVHEDFREDGVGLAILNALVEWARASTEVEKVMLKVHHTNARAIALYRKLGFIEEGRIKNDLKYADGHYVDTVIMGLWLGA